jgi:Zn-dependent metalloprotease
LCYKILILDPRSGAKTAYIDAHTGELVKAVRETFDYSATGTFATLYNGSKNAGTQYYNGTFNLSDSSCDVSIHTWDLNNDYDYNWYFNRVEFTDGDNTWTSGEHSTNNDQMALDIHWALQQIYDYFVNKQDGFAGFDGSNHDIDAYVHCLINKGDYTYTKDNAGFNPDWEAFFFGDGQSHFKPLASADIIAHEYGHAITYAFTGWTKDSITSVQSGINEGFSDCWAAIIEHEIAPSNTWYKMGEQVINVSGKNCQRNIAVPSSTSAATKISDTYNDDEYNTGRPYEMSGVLSHWAYLLINGGTGDNDNDDHYNVYSIGFDNVAKLLFRTQTEELASVEDFTDLMNATIAISNDEFGMNSFETLQVKNAWYAVGLGTNPGQTSMSGPSLVCYSTESPFTVYNLPSGATITWQYETSLLEPISEEGSNPCNFLAIGSGNAWVKAIINTTHGQYSLPQVNCSAGIPTILYLEGPTYILEYQGDTYCAEKDVWNFDAQYYWSLGPAGYVSSPTNEFYTHVTFGSADTYTLEVYACNSCGCTDSYNLEIDVSRYYRLMLSPNPSTSETTVSLQSTSGEITDNDPDWYLEVYNQGLQQKILSKNIKGKEFRLNTSNWIDGLYIIHAKYKGKWLIGKLVVGKK